jgi:hypothetical protein
MKFFIKTLLVGLVAFLIMRFFLLVTRAGDSIGTAATKALFIPVQLIGIGLGLASQPDKWDDAADIAKVDWRDSAHLDWKDRFLIVFSVLGKWANLVDVEKPKIISAQDQVATDIA